MTPEGSSGQEESWGALGLQARVMGTVVGLESGRLGVGAGATRGAGRLQHGFGMGASSPTVPQ